jgi:hypothetical protein
MPVWLWEIHLKNMTAENQNPAGFSQSKGYQQDSSYRASFQALKITQQGIKVKPRLPAGILTGKLLCFYQFLYGTFAYIEYL